MVTEEREGPTSVEIGNELWIKPSKVCCKSPGSGGKVGDIYSQKNLSFDDVAYHFLDIYKDCQLVI